MTKNKKLGRGLMCFPSSHLFSLPDSCFNQRVPLNSGAETTERKGTRRFRNVWTSWCSSIPRAQPTDLKCDIKENTAWPLTGTLFIVKMLQGTAPLIWSLLCLAGFLDNKAKDQGSWKWFRLGPKRRKCIMNMNSANRFNRLYPQNLSEAHQWWIRKSHSGVAAVMIQIWTDASCR